MLWQNKRYQNLVVKPEEYIPDMGLDYSEDDPVARMFKSEYIYDFPVDENYPFVDDRKGWVLKQKYYAWPFVLKVVVGFFMLRCKMGLRFEGRDVLKRYKKEMAGGVISLSNHCYFIDCPAVLLAIKAKCTVKIPMFAPNFRTKNRDLMRMVGGIPIPPAEAGLSAMKKFNEAFDTFHERGYSFHIFPEAAQWPFYKPLRPFQKGAFTMAYKYDMPLLPCVVTYRKRTGIYKLFGPANMPLLTVRIGEPVFPDKTQPRKVEVDRLREAAHKEMEALAGIVQNTWPIVPEKE